MRAWRSLLGSVVSPKDVYDMYMVGVGSPGTDVTVVMHDHLRLSLATRTGVTAVMHNHLRLSLAICARNALLVQMESKRNTPARTGLGAFHCHPAGALRS